VKIVVDDDLVDVDEPPRQRRPDEAGAARQQDSLALKRHGASLVLLLALLSLLSGCGGGLSEDPAPTRRGTALEITAWPAGRSGDQREWTLRCSPDGGTLPDPEQACRRLDDLDRPFHRPRNAICTEIYGGPAVARVRGTFDGAEVDASFARTDGCQIALWDRHAFLFPVRPAS
jgi:hypothetical protein